MGVAESTLTLVWHSQIRIFFSWLAIELHNLWTLILYSIHFSKESPSMFFSNSITNLLDRLSYTNLLNYSSNRLLTYYVKFLPQHRFISLHDWSYKKLKIKCLKSRIKKSKSKVKGQKSCTRKAMYKILLFTNISLLLY